MQVSSRSGLDIWAEAVEPERTMNTATITSAIVSTLPIAAFAMNGSLENFDIAFRICFMSLVNRAI